MSRLTDRIERLVETISPTWAAQRAAARLALRASERLTSSRGATLSRLDKEVKSSGASPDWDNEWSFDRRKSVDRARQLERDNVLALAALDCSTRAVVGDGFGHQAKSGDKAWNAQHEALWTGWAESTEADARRILTFPEIMAMVFRSKLRDGDVGSAYLADGSIRIFESDEISSPAGQTLQPNMVDGVELDAVGRPIGFHVLTPRQDRFTAGDRRSAFDRLRIPTEQFAFLARRTRAGQTRGVTNFSTVFWPLEQAEGSIEAVTVAARMAACFGLVIKKKAGPGPGVATQRGPDGVDRTKLRLEPGGTIRLGLDEDIHQVTPTHPASGFSEHMRLLIRLVGIAFGLPIELLLLDSNGANYSSMRGSLLQAWQVWRREQTSMKRYATRARAWKTINWIEEGLLTFREDALLHAWVTPGWQWLDPVAEIQAALAAIDAGFDSYTAVAARLGMDHEELLAVRKREIEARRAAGVPEVRSTLTRDPGQPPPGQAAPPGVQGSGAPPGGSAAGAPPQAPPPGS